MKNKDILWVDLETTGLHPGNCAIIEASFKLTDIKAEEEKFSISSTIDMPFSPNQLVWDDFARQMHEESGLYQKLGNSNGMTIQDLLGHVENNLKNSLPWDQDNDKYMEDAAPYLGGQSGHFDRSFLNHTFWDVEKFTSHRLLDVRTLMTVAKQQEIELPEDEKKHRAKPDLENTIDIYKAFLDKTSKICECPE